MSELGRARHLQRIQGVLDRVPICSLLGPRQCGKTTLAREFARRSRQVAHFDLETARDREALAQPELALSPLRGLVVIDEIQRLPGLFETLRPLADRAGDPARFLVLGSASPTLVRGVSESLAGRVGFVDIGGLDLTETGADAMNRLWLRGGFPRSYLARTEAAAVGWRADFIRTLLERDVPALGVKIAPESLRRLWTMIAHYHGQVWKGSELARSLGVSEHSIRRWLDVLAGTFVVRVLPPWFENVAKRQRRSPKVYVRDSGLLHALLSVESRDALLTHPKLGASWEGFAMEQILAITGRADLSYWATHGGAELDLFVQQNGRRYGVEFKYADAPGMTKSLHTALADLALDRAFIVHPGVGRYAVHEKVEVLPLSAAVRELPFVDGEVRGGGR